MLRLPHRLVAALYPGRFVRSLRSRITPLRLTGVVAALLAAGAVFGVYAQTAPARPPDTITVSGQATASQPPDLATVFGSVQTRADTPAAAADQNSRTLQAVIDAVQALGVSPDDIVTTGFTVSPLYSYTQPQPGEPSQPPEVVGYQAVNGISVNTKKLKQASDILQAMAAAGATDLSGPSYGLQNSEQLRVQAVRGATDDALQKAQAMAAVLGVKLGDILTVTEGFTNAPPPPPPPPPRPTVIPVATALPVAPPPVLPPSSLSATAGVTVVFAVVNPALAAGQ